VGGWRGSGRGGHKIKKRKKNPSGSGPFLAASAASPLANETNKSKKFRSPEKKTKQQEKT
jgi:hypothetical protein